MNEYVLGLLMLLGVIALFCFSALIHHTLKLNKEYEKIREEVYSQSKHEYDDVT